MLWPSLGVAGVVLSGVAVLKAVRNSSITRGGHEGDDGEEQGTSSEWASRRDALLAVVTHDMLNALAGLGGYLELLEDEPTSARGRELQARLSQLTDRLSSLSGDLLLDTTAGLDQVAVAPAVLVVVDELRACASSFPNLEIHVRVDKQHQADDTAPRTLGVRADSLRLHQVLANLVRNAERYGRPPVTLTAKLVATAALDDEAGRLVQIVVSDAGDGVPADFVDHLFEPYRRGPNATAARTPVELGPARIGVGLGLALSRELTERQGGTLTYQRETHEFTISLPKA